MENDTGGDTKSKPVRGRGKKVRDAVLAATIEELAEVGYAALTMEGVAQRAGVHKTTVYRRWKDRERLVVDAVSEHVELEVSVPDTGTLEGDLRLLARGLVQWVSSTSGQAIITTMVSGAEQTPEIAQARRDFYRNRFRQTRGVVDRAIERGEIPEGTVPEEVLKSLASAVFFRALVLPEPLDVALADRAASIALAAARAGVFRDASSSG